jgi:hypothetical protein
VSAIRPFHRRHWNTNLPKTTGIYGIGSVVAAVSSRENGPLVCLLVTIVIAVFGGSEPRLPTVKGWHMEWLWYMSPGVGVHLLINMYAQLTHFLDVVLGGLC